MSSRFNLIVLFSSVTIASSLAAMQDLATSTAALALRKPLAEVRALQTIPVHELKNIHKLDTPNTETYHVTLSDGNTIRAYHFHAGSMKDQTSCMRTLLNDDGMSVFLPISTHYFHTLKEIYETENNTQ